MMGKGGSQITEPLLIADHDQHAAQVSGPEIEYHKASAVQLSGPCFAVCS